MFKISEELLVTVIQLLDNATHPNVTLAQVTQIRTALTTLEPIVEEQSKPAIVE